MSPFQGRWRHKFGTYGRPCAGWKPNKFGAQGNTLGTMSPFPTPCKGKSKSQPFAHTFALTGRRRLCADTQGVALGLELIALSGRSFSRFVRLSCVYALPLIIWLKTAQRFFWILNTLPAPQKTQVANPASQLVGERRPRFIRFISQTRPSLVPDADAPRPRDECVWAHVRQEA